MVYNLLLFLKVTKFKKVIYLLILQLANTHCKTVSTGTGESLNPVQIKCILGVNKGLPLCKYILSYKLKNT